MRRTELDLCRIAACLMVLMIHTGSDIYHNYPFTEPAFKWIMVANTLPRGSVPVFFMLSGALLLSREELELRSFLNKHVLRLVGLFFFWSAVYAVGSRVKNGSFGDAYDFFYDVAAGHYHLWFLWAMILCGLFMPVLSSAIHGKKLAPGYLLGLFLLLGLLCANLNLTPDPAYILNRLTLNLSLERLPYLGYALWGFWLSQRSFSKRWLWIAPLSFLYCTALASGANLWYSAYKNEADGWLFSYFSIPSFIQASSVFCFFLALRGRRFRCERLISALAECTLGVYLIHPMLIEILPLLGLEVKADALPVSLLIFTLAVAVGSFALTAIGRKLPIVKKLL